MKTQPLKKKSRPFREKGITVASILTALGTVISALVVGLTARGRSAASAPSTIQSGDGII